MQASNTVLDTDNPGTQGFAMDSAGSSDFVNMHATGGTFDNVIIGESAVARDLSLKGFKAGDVVLRTLIDPGSPVTVANETKSYWSQICGTGTIRVKWDYIITGSLYYPMQIGINNTIQITKTYGEGESGSDYVDIDINEGESVYILICGGGAGAVTGTITVSNLRICTDGANGILAYLGSTTTSTYSSGAR